MLVAANTNHIDRFEVGNTYSCRSFCDYDCVFSFVVTKRTEKFVWLAKAYNRNDVTRRKIRVYDGVERCDPHGQYSMSPILSANREDA